ncbi:MAG: hypothetical protein RJA10_2005 [Pseudomonadota bacterium]|jgi:hypothetical protein
MLRRLSVMAATMLVLMLAFEGLFRLLPVSTSTDTGYHHDPDILNYPARHEWQLATGWDLRNAQRLRANNMGFAAHRDFVPDAKAVALIGDSFVEASMLPEADRPGPQLERALGGRPVYSLEGPGSSLLDYADRIRLARQTLKVVDFIVLVEVGDVRQALCGSGHVHSACLDPSTLEPRREHLPAAGALKRLLRHSALAQYLVSQLRLEPARLLSAVMQAVSPRSIEPAAAVMDGIDPAAIQAVTREFFSRLGSPDQYRRMLFLVDGRHDLNGPPLSGSLQAERTAFMVAAKQWGAEVFDAEEAYADHQTRSRRLLEVGPYDGHLNALGVRVLFSAAARRLEAMP